MSQIRPTVDVLVIGAGGAGGMAAIRAAEAGSEVTLISKTPLVSGNTPIAFGGHQAPLVHGDPLDTPERFVEDAIRQGGYLVNRDIAISMGEEIVQVTLDLESWGADFTKIAPGKIWARPIKNTSFPRGVCRGEKSGLAVSHAISKRAAELPIVKDEGVIVTNLLVDEGRCVGAEGINVRSGDLVRYPARVTVLACGGLGALFHYSDNPLYMTGDGYCLAAYAGVRLMDMEMVQYQITTSFPDSIKNIPLHPSELFEAGARLLDASGNDIPVSSKGGLDAKSLTTRVFTEIQEGRGTPNGGVYLDFSEVDMNHLKKIRPSFIDRVLRGNVHLGKEPVEVTPGVHMMIGGIVIDEKGRTDMPGLYAAGEVASGLHGSNRLGGNALTEALAGGSFAGRYASLDAITLPEPDISKIKPSRTFDDSKEGTAPPTETKHRIRTIMENVRGFRTERRLTSTIEELEKLRQKDMGLPRNKSGVELREAIETKFMADAGLLIAHSALARRATLGYHLRLDYPSLDTSRLRNITTFSENNVVVQQIIVKEPIAKIQ